MRLLFFFFSLVLLSSCSTKSKQTQPKWLIGDWERLNNKPMHKNYESWHLDSNNNLIGIGFTLKEKDTTFKENIAIITINDSLFFQVTGVNENPTLFKFTQQSDSSFICKNPTNEFPKKISYTKSKNNLNAIVSNDEFKIEFLFKRKND